MDKKLIENLKKQHYGIVGNHSAVQICRWTKKSLLDEGVCFKEKFYGIKSHSCCQMSPSVGFCENRCLHCWRAIELTQGNNMEKEKIDNPEFIINECIKQQRILLSGFNGNDKTNKKKFKEAQNPEQFAISLTGEPTLYPKLGELIKLLREKKKTSFLVTNGLQPAVLSKLNKEKALPTQLYLSMNSPNKEMYERWHNSKEKNSWKKFNETIALFPKLKTRKVIRMTLVKGLNDNMKEEYIQDYAKMIKKSKPDFIEVKGFMSVGFARNRKGMGYDSMPTNTEIKDFAKKLAKSFGLKILSSHEFSNVVLIGKNKRKMKIKTSEI